VGIERDGKHVDLTITPERRSGNRLSKWGWLLAAGNLVTLILAFVVAFRRSGDLIARIGGWFLATAAISIFPPVYGTASAARHLPAPLHLLLWVTLVSEAVFPAILLTFFAVFPQPLFRRRWIWVLIWAPALLATVPQLSEVFATLYERPLGLARYVISTAAWFALRGLYLLGGLVLLGINYRRLKDVNQQRRVRVLAVGSAVGWTAMGMFLTIIVIGGGRTLAAIDARVPLLPLLLCFYLLFPLSFAYAILRHRVFDLGLMVRRGLQYALARRLLVSAMPVLAAILLLDLLLHGNQPMLAVLEKRGWVYAGLAALAAIAYMKRQKWLEALDRRFFRERYDAQRLLREVVEEVRSARSFGQVAPGVAAHIETALHPEFVSLLAREPHEPGYRSLAAAPS
jgi:hypothetical protein